MSSSYANITLHAADFAAVVRHLKQIGTVAYVAPAPGGRVVIYHEDWASQEPLAAELSSRFSTPALLVMAFDQRMLLYQLYEAGQRSDEYVSEAHEAAELAARAGDADRLADAFARPAAARRIAAILGKPATDGNGYAYAANRHGDVCAALRLPTIAVGTSFNNIELGELPPGPDFDPATLIRA